MPNYERQPVAACEERTELLFAYGTLQLGPVQFATFGRKLRGTSDELPGFELVTLMVDDPWVIEVSGKAEHTMATFTGLASDVVPGTAFEVTPEEILRSDDYEVAAVERVAVVLGSGVQSWAYVDARGDSS